MQCQIYIKLERNAAKASSGILDIILDSTVRLDLGSFDSNITIAERMFGGERLKGGDYNTSYYALYL